MPDRYTTEEAAAILKVEGRRVRQLIEEHGLEVERIGKAIFLSRDQVEYLRDRKRTPGPAPKGIK